MTTATFVNNSTRSDAAWAQTVNDLAYLLFQAVDAVTLTAAAARGALKTASALTAAAGTNTVTATATPTPVAYVTGDSYILIPANTNTGATTLNLNSLGAKNVFVKGAACIGAELLASVPYLLMYDGTQFNVIGLYYDRCSSMSFSCGLTTVADGLTRYIGAAAVSAAESDVSIRVPYACTIRNLYATCSGASAGNRVYTLRKNGADTALTSTATAVTDSSDVTHSVTFAAGDKLSLKLVTSGGADTATHNATVELVKTGT